MCRLNMVSSLTTQRDDETIEWQRKNVQSIAKEQFVHLTVSPESIQLYLHVSNIVKLPYADRSISFARHNIIGYA